MKVNYHMLTIFWVWPDLKSKQQKKQPPPHTQQYLLTQYRAIDSFETWGDHEVKTQSFYNNVTNNANVINTNDVTFSGTYDHSIIKNMISQKHFDEETLTYTKDEELSNYHIMSVSSKLYKNHKRNKNDQTTL